MKILLVIFFFFFVATPVFASPSISIISVPDSLVAGESATLTASASGLLANNAYNIKIRIGSSSSELTKAETNNPSNSSPDDWLSDTSSWSKFPIIIADAEGRWTGNVLSRPSINSNTGLNLIVVRLHHSINGENSDSSHMSINILPAPTSAPTNTPSPTNTPGPTNTPVPSATPVPSSTPKPSATPKVIPTPVVELLPSMGEQEMVNASMNGAGTKLLNLDDEEPPPSGPSVLGETTEKKNTILPVLFIILGVVGLTVSLFLLYRHSRQADILTE